MVPSATLTVPSVGTMPDGMALAVMGASLSRQGSRFRGARLRSRLSCMTSPWVEIGDRVFVRRYAFYDQNIVVVRGGDRTLVVDTRSTPAQAREVVADARGLGIGRFDVVVNSHGHYDHVFGNHELRPAVIWGHERCATMIRLTGDRQRRRVCGGGAGAGRRPRGGRAGPARPDVRGPRRHRPGRARRGAGVPGPRAHRQRHRHLRLRMRTSCVPGTCWRTERRRPSATGSRWTGRRPWRRCWR